MASSQSELRMRPRQPPFEAAQSHPPSEKSRRPETRRHPLPPQSPFEAFLLHYWSGELLQKVTEAAVDGGGLLGAAIFRKEDGSARLQIEAGAGAAVALIAKMQISTDPAVPHGQGLGGIAFRSNKPCISNNVTSDTRT